MIKDTHVLLAKENALDFLLFGYFGIDLKEALDYDNSLSASIKRAYIDATNQGAFNALIEKTNTELRKKADVARDNAEQILTDETKKLIEENKAYGDWHSNICKNIISQFETAKNVDGEILFSYGNAQKWVNMTMKYLYLISGCIALLNLKEMPIWCKTILEKSSQFHIPVDSYIIKKLWDKEMTKSSNNKTSEGIELPIKEETEKEKIYRRDGKLGAYDTKKIVAWSNWNDIDYTHFWNSIKNNKVVLTNETSPIEWEGKAWIAQAKIEKK